MTNASKTGVVLGGYAAALFVTYAVFHVYVLMRKEIDPSGGGMQAFGDFILLLGLFGVLALIPTALGLYYLRPFARFWPLVSYVSLAIAAMGPVAAMTLGRSQQSPWVQAVGFFALLKVLASPLLGVGFLVAAFIAPRGRSRWLLLAAATVEFVVIAYAGFCLVVVRHWL